MTFRSCCLISEPEPFGVRNDRVSSPRVAVTLLLVGWLGKMGVIATSITLPSACRRYGRMLRDARNELAYTDAKS
jgi:hypothetical protein